MQGIHSMYDEGHILRLQLGKIQLFCFEQDELAATITGVDKLSLIVINFIVAAWADMIVSELLFNRGHNWVVWGEDESNWGQVKKKKKKRFNPKKIL